MIKNNEELFKTLKSLAANQNFPVARKVECIFHNYAAVECIVNNWALFNAFDFTEGDKP